jgi:hypothetical protein
MRTGRRVLGGEVKGAVEKEKEKKRMVSVEAAVCCRASGYDHLAFVAFQSAVAS